MEHNSESTVRLFISRKLEADSPFHDLKQKGWDIVDISFLQIEYIRVDKIPESDWIFFYSSNGVKAFAEIVKDLQFDIQSVQIGAYGEATAASIRKQNWPLNFTGTGQAKSTAEKFLPLLNNHKVLFPKAIYSQNALIPYISNKAQCICLTVYQNHMLPHFLDEVCQYYLFTSGLNVESFFQYNHIPAEASVLAIGFTTAQKLEKYYEGTIHIPPVSSEKSLLQLVRKLS